MTNTVLIAGATGNLGGKITDFLLKKGATVKAIVRQETAPEKIMALKQKGVEVMQLDMTNSDAIATVCAGVGCVVSALAGLRETIVDTQKILLDGAVKAQVPRFIPSDYCTDFTHLVPGQNRNLDTRRDFHQLLNQANIKPTSIFNGAFMELTTGDMPLILFQKKRVLCWGNPNTKMDLTTTFNVAEYTACAALDDNSPRYLKIAGDTVSAHDVKSIMSEITQTTFSLLKPGSIGLLNMIIKIVKFFDRSTTDLYPAWQGMQYMRDMMEGRAALTSHDNQRYAMEWTSLKTYLTTNGVPK